MNDVLKSPFMLDYKKDLFTRLENAGISSDLIDADKLNNFILKNYKNEEVELHNSIKNEYVETSILELVELIYYSESKPIITGYNTLFYNHDKVTNIPAKFLDALKVKRDNYKKEMYKYINSADDQYLYNVNNFLQLIMKLIGNSYYGAFGMAAFHFFNKHLGPSVTAQGRQLISSAILAFEGFIAGNNTFVDFDDLTNFLNNIFKEEYFEDAVLELDFEITSEMLINKYKNKCVFELKEHELEYLELVINDDLSETIKQKLYFKNDLFKFFEVEQLKKTVKNELVVTGFHDPNKPPEEIKESLDSVAEYIRYFVSYPYPYRQKTKVASTMYRDVVLVCDTDSNFLYVYKWLEYVCGLIEMKSNEISIDQRASIISVINYFVTVFINEVFRILCLNCNVPEDQLYRINMKSEYHFSRVILTKNKKSYAGKVLSKEGRLYDKPKYDIKGIPIKKTTTPKPARIFFSNLLEEEMLNKEELDIKSIYAMYHGFAKNINDKLKSGETGSLKNGIIKILSSYKEPYRMQTVRAVLIWNALYPSEYINQSTSFKILDLVKTIPPAAFIKNKDTDEEHFEDNEQFYEFLESEFGSEFKEKIEVLFDKHEPLKKYGLTQIAIPLHFEKIPEEFLKFADVDDITNSVVKKGNILLESLGFVLIESKRRSIVSNIIKI